LLWPEILGSAVSIDECCLQALLGLLIGSEPEAVNTRDEHGSGLDQTGSGLKPILGG